MTRQNDLPPDPPTPSETEASESAAHFGPVTQAEIDDIIELIFMRPPAYWMTKISAADLRVFLDYAVGSSHSILLAARPANGASPVGFVFAVIDSVRFWAVFFLRNPVLARSIVFHRLVRLHELRRRNKARARADAAAARLPAFSWSPNRRGYARIIGLYVRKEHHNKGVAMDLYFSLFDLLREKGCVHVEEYAAPDYAEFAGKFPKVCGWSLQPCVCGGYKISRAL